MRILGIIIALFLLASCAKTLTSSDGFYPQDPSGMNLSNSEVQTVRVDQVRHSMDDVMFALKRAVNMQGGTIDYETERHFRGFASVPSPEASCTAQVSFAAYLNEIDDKPTTKFIFVVNHQGICASPSLFGNPRNDEFARSVSSNLYTILSTYE